MHMADALLSPAVGGGMWAVSAASIAYCSSTMRRDLDDRKVPLMGVLGAFLFAAQMINFSIPGTGSSGHLGGGLLLAVLLGPGAAFLTIASVLMVQALFFADGGLLALGCNIFNIGFLPAFLVYPLCFRKLAGPDPSAARLSAVTILSAVVCLQLGPLAVVLETAASGLSSLPLNTFLLLMQPIHLAIGIVEGLVTVAILSSVRRARPELLKDSLVQSSAAGQRPLRQVALAFLLLALVTGGVLSAFASKDPDGLEWALARVTGHSELAAPQNALHRGLAALQQKTALLPDYDFRNAGQKAPANESGRDARRFHPGTGLSGVLGALLTLGVAALLGLLAKKRSTGKAYGIN
jgi:cobalt/nickel transport system permease protein